MNHETLEMMEDFEHVWALIINRDVCAGDEVQIPEMHKGIRSYEVYAKYEEVEFGGNKRSG